MTNEWRRTRDVSLEPRTPEGERMLDRRGFLRQVGLTALAAVGFVGASAALPKEAFAAGTLCRCLGYRGNCASGKLKYSCYNACTGSTFPACFSGGCYNRQFTC
jgi:hypothetical protein